MVLSSISGPIKEGYTATFEPEHSFWTAIKRLYGWGLVGFETREDEHRFLTLTESGQKQFGLLLKRARSEFFFSQPPQWEFVTPNA
jgi:hypothetical protein